MHASMVATTTASDTWTQLRCPSCGALNGKAAPGLTGIVEVLCRRPQCKRLVRFGSTGLLST